MSQFDDLSVQESYNLTDVGLVAIVDSCIKLDTVDVRLCIGISDEGIRKLFHCSGLKSVCVSGTRLNDASFKFLANNCPVLQKVFMFNCPHVCDLALIALSQCKQLKVLWCGLCPLISDAGVLAIAENCSLLESIAMTRCSLLTDISVIAVVKMCPNLRALKIAGLENITDASILEIAEHAHNLETLDINDVDDNNVTSDAVVTVAKRCFKLKLLIVSEGSSLCSPVSQMLFHHFLPDLVISNDSDQVEE